MLSLGLKVRTDPVGNLYGKIEGTNPQAKTIRIISHLDTVRQGGNYDGVTGIISGLEIIRRLKSENVKLTNPVEIVVYRCEESARFGKALIGSGFASGEIDWAKSDKELIQSLVEAMSACGFYPVPAKQCDNLTDIEMVVEIHPEQGNTLAENNKDIGIVEGIAAPVRTRIYFRIADKEQVPNQDLKFLRIKGEQSHSGTTGMLTRKDAVCACAELVMALEKGAKRSDLVYGLYIKNAAMNIVPGEVEIALKIEAQELDILEKTINSIARKRKISIEEINPLESQVELRKDAAVYMTVLDIAFNLEKDAKSLYKKHEQGSKPVGTIGSIVVNREKRFDRLELSVDIRGFDLKTRSELDNAFRGKAKEIIAKRLDLRTSQIKWKTSHEEPVILNNTLRSELAAITGKLGIFYTRLPSGAGHDTLNFKNIPGGRIAMLFVPSVGGISHNSEEFTETKSIIKACDVLYSYLITKYANHQETKKLKQLDKSSSNITATGVIDVLSDEASRQPQGWLYPRRDDEVISVKNIPFRVSPYPLYLNDKEAKLLTGVGSAMADFFLGSNQFLSTEKSWREYFLYFSTAARKNY